MDIPIGIPGVLSERQFESLVVGLMNLNITKNLTIDRTALGVQPFSFSQIDYILSSNCDIITGAWYELYVAYKRDFRMVRFFDEFCSACPTTLVLSCMSVNGHRVQVSVGIGVPTLKQCSIDAINKALKDSSGVELLGIPQSIKDAIITERFADIDKRMENLYSILIEADTKLNQPLNRATHHNIPDWNSD